MPDDYPWLPGSTRFPLGDLGEVAARLGSPVVYDRRGELIWLDDFRHGVLGWEYSGSGLNNGCFLVTSTRYTGPYCMELHAGALLAGGLAQVTKSFSALNLGRCGVETVYQFSTDASYFQVTLTETNNFLYIPPAIRHNFSSRVLQYLGSDILYHTFATLPAADPGPTQWLQLKLVVDFDTRKYIRVLFEETEYDLNGIDLPSLATTDANFHSVILTLKALANLGETVHVAHVILTGNEQ